MPDPAPSEPEISRDELFLKMRRDSRGMRELRDYLRGLEGLE